MNVNEMIARINELYHKSKEEGLTDAEKEEQAKLRKAYVDNIKASMSAQLDNTYIKNPDGSLTKVAKRMDLN